MKVRTPKELATKKRPERKVFSYSLNKANAERLAKLAEANGLPVSELVDEAIRAYLDAIDRDKEPT